MSKNKKTFTILGLSVLAVTLVIILGAMSQPTKQTDTLSDTETVTSVVTPNEIEDIIANPVAPIISAAPEVKPIEIVTPEPITKTQTNDILLTVIEDKPEPPELPEHVKIEINTGDDEPQDTPTDSVLTNPEVKPDVTPKPVEPTKPTETMPNSGSKNNNGEIYISGFGWVKDEGGGGQGEKSGSDGDWNKIIGH